MFQLESRSYKCSYLNLVHITIIVTILFDHIISPSDFFVFGTMQMLRGRSSRVHVEASPTIRREEVEISHDETKQTNKEHALTQICTQILEVVDSEPLKRWYCWLAMVLSRRKILVTEIGRIERLELHEVFYMFEARDGCGGTYLVLLDGVGEDFFSRWPGEDERREIESAAKLCLISKTQNFYSNCV